MTVTVAKHLPSEYHGEDLCPRCGIGAVTGWRYPICADRRDDGTCWPHEETCKRYTYGDLCAECERTLIDETGGGNHDPRRVCAAAGGCVAHEP